MNWTTTAPVRRVLTVFSTDTVAQGKLESGTKRFESIDFFFDFFELLFLLRAMFVHKRSMYCLKALLQ
jgi:hypothetical protein